MARDEPDRDNRGAEVRDDDNPNDPFYLAALRLPYYANNNPVVSVDRRPQHVQVEEDWNDIGFLQLEILRLRDEVIGALAREGEVRARLDGLLNSEARWEEHNSIKNHKAVLAQKEDAEARLEAVLRSRTWKLGRALFAPIRLVRRALTGRSRDS